MNSQAFLDIYRSLSVDDKIAIDENLTEMASVEEEADAMRKELDELSPELKASLADLQEDFLKDAERERKEIYKARFASDDPEQAAELRNDALDRLDEDVSEELATPSEDRLDDLHERARELERDTLEIIDKALASRK